jgi:hypothetical protein
MEHYSHEKNSISQEWIDWTLSIVAVSLLFNSFILETMRMKKILGIATLIMIFGVSTATEIKFSPDV